MFYNGLAMERFVEIDHLLQKDGYTRRQLFDLIQRYYPLYDDNSCSWVLGSLLERKVLYNAGYDAFFKKGNSFEIEMPSSPLIKEIISALSRLDSGAKYSCYSPERLNAVLNDVAAIDAIIFEVEKKWLYPLYLELKSKTKSSILLNPSDDEFARYYAEGCLILRPLPSKAPCKGGRLLIEKLCVDLLKGEFDASFPLLEPEQAAMDLISSFDMNIKTMLSYAERRGVKTKAINLVYEALPKAKLEIMKMSNKFPKREMEDSKL